MRLLIVVVTQTMPVYNIQWVGCTVDLAVVSVDQLGNRGHQGLTRFSPSVSPLGSVGVSGNKPVIVNSFCTVVNQEAISMPE